MRQLLLMWMLAGPGVAAPAPAPVAPPPSSPSPLPLPSVDLTRLPVALAEGDLALAPGMVVDIMRSDEAHRWRRVGIFRVLTLDEQRAGIELLSGTPDIREGDELIREGNP